MVVLNVWQKLSYYIKIAPTSNTMPASLLNKQIQLKLYIMVATLKMALGIEKDSASFVGLPASSVSGLTKKPY